MDGTARWIAAARAAEPLRVGPALKAAGSLAALLDGESPVPGEAGAAPRVARILRESRPDARDHRAAEVAGELGIRVVPFGDDRYPADLAQTADPPAVLFVRGQGDLAGSAPRVGVVGARACTPRGARVARDLAEALARAGVTVVSGMARGVDAAGHDGALSARGETWAVLAGGLERASPATLAPLYGRILEGGLAVAEVPPGVPPEPFRFPRRNRVIAGLVKAVVVVEAEERSGALITARLAAEEGREVMAVPGPVDSPLSRGPHRLIRAGAALVEDARDLLESLGLARVRSGADASAETGGDAPWRAWFGGGAVDVDTLIERSRLPIGALQAELLRLELEGFVLRTEAGTWRPATGTR